MLRTVNHRNAVRSPARAGLEALLNSRMNDNEPEWQPVIDEAQLNEVIQIVGAIDMVEILCVLIDDLDELKRRLLAAVNAKDADTARHIVQSLYGRAAQFHLAALAVQSQAMLQAGGVDDDAARRDLLLAVDAAKDALLSFVSSLNLGPIDAPPLASSHPHAPLRVFRAGAQGS